MWFLESVGKVSVNSLSKLFRKHLFATIIEKGRDMPQKVNRSCFEDGSAQVKDRTREREDFFSFYILY